MELDNWLFSSLSHGEIIRSPVLPRIILPAVKRSSMRVISKRKTRVVETGRNDIQKKHRSMANQSTRAIMKNGDYFGEMAFFEKAGDPFASARTLQTTSQLIVISVPIWKTSDSQSSFHQPFSCWRLFHTACAKQTA